MITVTKKDLIELGYGTSFAADIIRVFSPLLFVELLEELQVVLEHQTDVVDAVLQHGDTLDADAESEAGVLVRVPSTSIQPVCLHSGQPLPWHSKQLTSTSTLGSVNGK